MNVKRVSSGVQGLDDLIQGGFVEGSNVLIKGGPGTGKSILGLQFIVYGALNGESGIYLTLEENKNKIISQAEQFGWDIKRLEKKEKMLVNTIDDSHIDIDEIFENLEESVKYLKARRLTLDSLSMMSIFVRVLDKISKTIEKPDLVHTTGQELTRSQTVGIIRKLSKLGTTNLLISEDDLKADKTAEFMADGVIRLQMTAIGKELRRLITIEKMRQTEVDCLPHRFEFSDDGIKVVE